MSLAQEKLPVAADRFISPAGDVLAVVFRRDPGKLLAARRRVASRYACLAQVALCETDRAGHGLHGQVAERIGPQPSGHAGLGLWRQAAILQKMRREQFAEGRHIDPVETRCDDRRTGHANVNLTRQASLPDSLQEDFERRRAHDRVLDENHPLVFQYLAERRVLGLSLALAVAAALDKRPPRVTIAN